MYVYILHRFKIGDENCALCLLIMCFIVFDFDCVLKTLNVYNLIIFDNIDNLCFCFF